MPQLNLAETTFVVASPDAVAREVRAPASWTAWCRGLRLEVTEDRGTSGLRWQVAGAVSGSAEVWLEPTLDGVLVHWFLRGQCRSRRPGSVADRHRRAWTRFVFALKDRLEAGREPGVKPVGDAAEG